jgi:hypothetical protein
MRQGRRLGVAVLSHLVLFMYYTVRAYMGREEDFPQESYLVKLVVYIGLWLIVCLLFLSLAATLSRTMVLLDTLTIFTLARFMARPTTIFVAQRPR